MEGVENEINLVAGEGRGEEAAAIFGGHVEFDPRGFANGTNDGIMASGAKAESPATGEV